MLVGLRGRHRDELEADFRQYYGLDLGGMGREYTVLHAARLASQLPAESRTAAAEGGTEAIGVAERLLALIEYDLRVLDYHLVAANTDKRGRSKLVEPEPPLFSEAYEARHRRVAGYRTTDIDSILAKPRR